MLHGTLHGTFEHSWSLLPCACVECPSRLESLNSRQNTILSGIQAFFWSRGRSRRSRKGPTASEKDPVRLLGPILRSGRHETKPTAEANSAHRPRKVRQRHTTHVERKRAGRQPLWTPHRSIIVPAMEPNSLPAAITSFPNPAPPAPTSQGARAQRSPRTLTINSRRAASDMPPLQLAGAETEQTNKAPSRPCAPTRSVPRQSSISSDAAAPHARRHAVGRTASSQRCF